MHTERTYYVANSTDHSQRSKALAEIEAFDERDKLNTIFENPKAFVVLRLTKTYNEKFEVALRPFKKNSNG